MNLFRLHCAILALSQFGTPAARGAPKAMANRPLPGPAVAIVRAEWVADERPANPSVQRRWCLHLPPATARTGHAVVPVYGLGFFVTRDGYAVVPFGLVARARALRLAPAAGGPFRVARRVLLDPEVDLALIKVEGGYHSTFRLTMPQTQPPPGLCRYVLARDGSGWQRRGRPSNRLRRSLRMRLKRNHRTGSSAATGPTGRMWAKAPLPIWREGSVYTAERIPSDAYGSPCVDAKGGLLGLLVPRGCGTNDSETAHRVVPVSRILSLLVAGARRERRQGRKATPLHQVCKDALTGLPMAVRIHATRRLRDARLRKARLAADRQWRDLTRATAALERRALEAKPPRWKARTLRALLSRIPVPALRPAQVEALFGPPTRRSHGVSKAGTTTVWHYDLPRRDFGYRLREVVFGGKSGVTVAVRELF